MRLNSVILGVLLVGMVGCGTRKVSTQISKTDTKEVSKELSSGNTSTSSTSSRSTETNEQVAKTDEKQESRTTERFDSSGRVTERITETIKAKSADNSKRSSVGRYDINTKTNTAYTNTLYRTITIHTKDKVKTVTSNRNGLYTMLFGIGVVAILCYGAYKLLTRA